MLTHYNPSNRAIGYWEEHVSPEGYSYWLWRKLMPRINPSLIFCVFYIYPSQDDAERNSQNGATGFFFGVKSEVSPIYLHLYAVTNFHVVFRDGMEKPVLRINTKDNRHTTFPTDRSNWRMHPDGDDIAICPIQFDDNRLDVDCFQHGYIIDDEFIKKFNVGAGDDIFMIGRFRTHAGQKKNLPTVRFGNIAAMNEEPLYNPFTQFKQESYIVEMRSMSGYSGSPVVLHIPEFSHRWTTIGDDNANFVTGVSYHGLLGINWGHIVYEEKAKDLETGRTLSIEMDSAMAGVVPVSKLMDLIDSEEMVEMRKKKDKETIVVKKMILQNQMVEG